MRDSELGVDVLDRTAFTKAHRGRRVPLKKGRAPARLAARSGLGGYHESARRALRPPFFPPTAPGLPGPSRAMFRPLLPVCSLALAAILAPEASAQLELTRSGGTVGAPLVYQISDGAPFAAYVWIPSGNTGPLPIASVDPADNRVLEVGLDLFTTWVIGGLDANGERTLVFGLPNDPGLVGGVIHAQAISLPGATTLVDEISNRTAFRFAESAGSTFTVEDAPLGLSGHTATTLPGGDVFLAGGFARDGAGFDQGADNLVRYDATIGAFDVLANTLNTPRSAHTATLLPDRSVLIVGGTDSAGNPTAAVERIHSTTGATIATSTLDTPRVFHTATLLPGGKVIVTGGTSNIDFSDPLAALGDVLRTTRIYDAATNTWSNGPNLGERRIGHRATALADGTVLVTGGLEVTFFFTIPIPAFVGDAQRYDPVSNSFSSAGSYSTGRAFHSQARLSDGRVMVVGGANGDVLSQTFTAIASSRIYDPVANTWSNGPSISQARAYGELVVAPGRSPALIGGLATVDVTTQSGSPADTIEVLDTTALTWSTAGTQLMARPISPTVLTDLGTHPRALSTGESLAGLGAVTPDLTAETFVLP